MDLPAEPLTVATVQATPTPGDIAGNAATAARLARHAAQREARLVVLPELFLPGYHPPALRADPETTSIRANDRNHVADTRLDPLRTAARDNGIAVVIGAAVRHDDGRRTCSILVVDRTGGITNAYDKQNLCGPDEKGLFTPGDSGATVRLEQWRLGLGICYDGCFPEHARAAALDGAHAYLASSAYLRGSEHRRDVYYRARALDNTMYVVFANVTGGDPPWTFNGGAAVHDPQGRILGKADDDGEAVIVATLDPAELAATRQAHPMLTDLRTPSPFPRRVTVA